MAEPYQIRRVFSQLGELFGAEHAEHDDEGAAMVHGLIKRLRKFAKHEQNERPGRYTLDGAVREAASYELHDGRRVWYDDGPTGKQTLQDASDLYAVLKELHGTGSPNLENQQALFILGRLQSATGLGNPEVSTLRKLLRKHRAAIEKLRRSRDRNGQNLMDTGSDGPESRIIHPDEEA